MWQPGITQEHRTLRRQSGFTLLEMLVGLAVMLIVVGVIMTAMFNMMKTQGTIQNRTEMHSSVRNATELLAQEIGQAGRIPQFQGTMTAAVGGALPGTELQPAAVNFVATISDTTQMFVGEYLVIDAGTAPVTNRDLEETVQVTAVTFGAPGTITATFTKAHNANVPVRVQGDFATGVVPPTMANGSDANNLKLYGDINGDGTLVYVEYQCLANAAGTGTLTRSVTPVFPGVAALSQGQVLLDNLVINPGGTPCFSYQPNPLLQDALPPPNGPNTYVFDVAVTLTVQTQVVDPQTGVFQRETKALLNIAPRNVFEAYQEATRLNATNRVQPMPADGAGLNVQGMLRMIPPPAY